MAKIDIAELQSIKNRLNTKQSEFTAETTNLKTAMQQFVNLNSFKGAAAEQMKNYVTSTHMPVVSAMSEVLQDEATTLTNLVSSFKSEVGESSDEAKMDSSDMKDFDNLADRVRNLAKVSKLMSRATSSGDYSAKRTTAISKKVQNVAGKQQSKKVVQAKTNVTDNAKKLQSAGRNNENVQIDKYQAVLKRENVQDIEKDTGIKKPKGMTDSKYRALVAQVLATTDVHVQGLGLSPKQVKKLYNDMADKLQNIATSDWAGVSQDFLKEYLTGMGEAYSGVMVHSVGKVFRGSSSNKLTYPDVTQGAGKVGHTMTDASTRIGRVARVAKPLVGVAAHGVGTSFAVLDIYGDTKEKIEQTGNKETALGYATYHAGAGMVGGAAAEATLGVLAELGLIGTAPAWVGLAVAAGGAAIVGSIANRLYEENPAVHSAVDSTSRTVFKYGKPAAKKNVQYQEKLVRTTYGGHIQ